MVCVVWKSLVQGGETRAFAHAGEKKQNETDCFPSLVLVGAEFLHCLQQVLAFVHVVLVVNVLRKDVLLAKVILVVLELRLQPQCFGYVETIHFFLLTEHFVRFHIFVLPSSVFRWPVGRSMKRRRRDNMRIWCEITLRV